MGKGKNLADVALQQNSASRLPLCVNAFPSNHFSSLGVNYLSFSSCTMCKRLPHFLVIVSDRLKLSESLTTFAVFCFPLTFVSLPTTLVVVLEPLCHRNRVTMHYSGGFTVFLLLYPLTSSTLSIESSRQNSNLKYPYERAVLRSGDPFAWLVISCYCMCLALIKTVHEYFHLTFGAGGNVK